MKRETRVVVGNRRRGDGGKERGGRRVRRERKRRNGRRRKKGTSDPICLCPRKRFITFELVSVSIKIHYSSIAMKFHSLYADLY